MILYVNGDSHSAGAEAVNNYAFAEDDPLYWRLGRRPHPDNERVSYGCELANMLGYVFVCDAESASSNTRILRTTKEYLKTNKPDLLVIGWSTWEREEWPLDDVYYQVTASGTDSVPLVFAERYRDWVIEQNEWSRENKMLDWHKIIYELHLELSSANIKHIFFNTYSNFSAIKDTRLKTENLTAANAQCLDWNNSYIGPYEQELTYYNWLKKSGFVTASPTSYHFKDDAHRAWANLLYESLGS
jgi:hypothetical protein